MSRQTTGVPTCVGGRSASWRHHRGGAASPALIEKVRTAATDAQGKYSTIELRPGIYTVAFTLPGFSTHSKRRSLAPGRVQSSTFITLRKKRNVEVFRSQYAAAGAGAVGAFMGVCRCTGDAFRRAGRADIHQGCRAGLPGEMPGLPSSLPGIATLASGDSRTARHADSGRHLLSEAGARVGRRGAVRLFPSEIQGDKT